jgi:hypothetical protein
LAFKIEFRCGLDQSDSNRVAVLVSGKSREILIVGENIRFLIRRLATSSELTGMNTFFCNLVLRDIKLISIVVRFSSLTLFEVLFLMTQG